MIMSGHEDSLRKESVEEYLGAIYRLQEMTAAPLPLSRLQILLKVSPISIHEMVQKLEKEALVEYVPYRGVTLTDAGMRVAMALVRRHRIWERFLTDSLNIEWDKAHELAGELEHAAPESVTERLADFLGDPQQCPHGSQIPAGARDGEVAKSLFQSPSQSLDAMAVGQTAYVAFISIEIPENLQFLQSRGIKPGTLIELIGRQVSGCTLKVDGRQVDIPLELASTLWVTGTL
jgi:DtxR family Mn-dependent transcriptional regulator